MTLRFRLELDIDVAAQEVQSSINAAGTYLPRDLPNPPIYSKSNPADAPFLTLAFTSKTLPLSQVEDLADTRFAQKISQLCGVGLVSISGGQKPAMRIQANPTALSSWGLNLEDVRGAYTAGECQSGERQHRWSAQAYTIGGPTIKCYGRSLSTSHCRVPKWLPCSIRPMWRTVADDVGNAPPGRLDEDQAPSGRHLQHSAATRSQHHRESWTASSRSSLN